jgi:hypothetical protein
MFFLTVVHSCAQDNDSIAKAETETEKILKEYEKSNDAKKVIDWIFANHGEAAGHQVMISLAKWSLNHQNDFALLVEGIDKNKQEEFAESFSFALTDSKMDGKFREKFKGANSNVIGSILRKIG